MLNGIKNIFYKVVSKILPASKVAESMNITLPMNNEMVKKIEDWKGLYKDEPYWIKGTGWDDFKTVGLASDIASEFARLTTLEFKSRVAGDTKEAEYIEEQYSRMIKKLRVQVEYATALGGLMMKPYIDGDKIAVEFVHADKFYPVAFSSDGEITSCIFIDTKHIGDKVYTKTEYHEYTEGLYTVSNKAFVRKAGTSPKNIGDPVGLETVPEWADLAKFAELPDIPRPLFAYFKMPFANTVNMESNLGVSVFARAEKLLKQADEMWNSLNWEFESKEMALDVDEDILNPIMAGGAIAYKAIPKGKERMFRTFQADSKGGQPFYNVFSPDIRVEEYQQGYNRILQAIEFKSGLAYGTLSDPRTVSKTATEILVAKQRSYATVSDIQSQLETALREVVEIMRVWVKLEKLAPTAGEKITVTFDWDDSLLTDSETEGKIRLAEVSAGILDPIHYIKWRYGIDDDDDESALALMPKVSDMVAETEIDETEE